MRSASVSTDYTPLKALRMKEDYRDRGLAPQVVYSKVAGRPTLHHAESWSPDAAFQSGSVSFETRSDLGPYSGARRNLSNLSNFGTYSKSRYDDRTIYHPPSTTQSDYGSLQKISHRRRRDYQYYSPPYLARTCGCSRDMSCSVCNPVTSQPVLPTENVYDTLRRDYKPVYEPNNNPLPALASKYAKTRRSSADGRVHQMPPEAMDTLRNYRSKDNYLHITRAIPAYVREVDDSSPFIHRSEPHMYQTPHKRENPRKHNPRDFYIPESVVDVRYNPDPMLPSVPPPTNQINTRRSASNGSGSFQVKKEWNKLRNLLNAVGAVKNLNRRESVKTSAASDFIVLPLPDIRRSRTEIKKSCHCVNQGFGAQCSACFDRKVQSARSCESLLASGNRIPSLDLGEGDIQVRLSKL